MVVGGIRHRANLDERYATERASPRSTSAFPGDDECAR